MVDYSALYNEDRGRTAELELYNEERGIEWLEHLKRELELNPSSMELPIEIEQVIRVLAELRLLKEEDRLASALDLPSEGEQEMIEDGGTVNDVTYPATGGISNRTRCEQEMIEDRGTVNEVTSPITDGISNRTRSESDHGYIYLSSDVLEEEESQTRSSMQDSWAQVDELTPPSTTCINTFVAEGDANDATLDPTNVVEEARLQPVETTHTIASGCKAPCAQVVESAVAAFLKQSGSIPLAGDDAKGYQPDSCSRMALPVAIPSSTGETSGSLQQNNRGIPEADSKPSGACYLEYISDIQNKLHDYCAELDFEKFDHKKWRQVLSQHTTNVPKEQRPSPISCVKDHLKTMQVDEYWHACLDVPNSYKAGDGLQYCFKASEKTEKLAEENVCQQAVAWLLLRNPEGVRLLANDWERGDVQWIRAKAHRKMSGGKKGSPPGLSQMSSPPGPSLSSICPPDTSSRTKSSSTYEAPLAGADAACHRDEQIRLLLTQILNQHNSTADPSRLRGGRDIWGPALARLIPLGTLKKWLQARSDVFQVHEHHAEGRNHWTFGWAGTDQPDWSRYSRWGSSEWSSWSQPEWFGWAGQGSWKKEVP